MSVVFPGSPIGRVGDPVALGSAVVVVIVAGVSVMPCEVGLLGAVVVVGGGSSSFGSTPRVLR